MPPEIIGKESKDQKPWSHDMWSLGVILLEISTGIPAYINKKSKIMMFQNKSTISVGLFGAKPRVRMTDGTIILADREVLINE
jgi:serine/threonine protein kinase